MTEFEVAFPTLLMQLHQLEFDYDDGDGIDFEPYQEFQSAKDTGDWIKAWTGNHDLRGSEYRSSARTAAADMRRSGWCATANLSSSSPSSSSDPRASWVSWRAISTTICGCWRRALVL